MLNCFQISLSKYSEIISSHLNPYDVFDNPHIQLPIELRPL